jgi:DNA (cytosine-5)-methyltransferase 1
MFSGIGGFELGIKRAIPDAEFVGYSEIDKYAIKIYERRFKGVRNYGDATKINERELPDFDLLVGGFPCQAFSIAGKRKGFEDTRGTLFFDIARILAYKKPKHIVLENVRGLLSHESGRTFQTILRVLSDLGYMVQWELLNSKNYGVPQNRERLYIIGHLGGGSGREVLPIRQVVKEDNTKNKRKIKIIKNLKGKGGHECHNVHSVEGIAPTMRENHGKITMVEIDRKPNEITKNVSQAYRVYDQDGIATTLKSEGGGIGAKTGLYSVFTKFRDGKMFIDDRSTCLDANYYKGFDNMGQRSGAARVLLEERRLSLDKSTIRRLTPLECERLQGFPEGWTEGLSDTQRYKTLGNAVTTNVVYEVIKRMYL